MWGDETFRTHVQTVHPQKAASIAQLEAEEAELVKRANQLRAKKRELLKELSDEFQKLEAERKPKNFPPAASNPSLPSLIAQLLIERKIAQSAGTQLLVRIEQILDGTPLEDFEASVRRPDKWVKFRTAGWLERMAADAAAEWKMRVGEKREADHREAEVKRENARLRQAFTEWLGMQPPDLLARKRAELKAEFPSWDAEAIDSFLFNDATAKESAAAC